MAPLTTYGEENWGRVPYRVSRGPAIELVGRGGDGSRADLRSGTRSVPLGGGTKEIGDQGTTYLRFTLDIDTVRVTGSGKMGGTRGAVGLMAQFQVVTR